MQKNHYDYLIKDVLIGNAKAVANCTETFDYLLKAGMLQVIINIMNTFLIAPQLHNAAFVGYLIQHFHLRDGDIVMEFVEATIDKDQKLKPALEACIATYDEIKLTPEETIQRNQQIEQFEQIYYSLLIF